METIDESKYTKCIDYLIDNCCIAQNRKYINISIMKDNIRENLMGFETAYKKLDKNTMSFDELYDFIFDWSNKIKLILYMVNDGETEIRWKPIPNPHKIKIHWILHDFIYKEGIFKVEKS